MIFVTIGSMLPFDRMIQAVDRWAQETGCDDLFAQIGNGQYEPRHMRWERMLGPREFSQKLEAASLLVAHAGMGTVISAMEAGKPVIVMPRRVAYHEVTTEHQVHTAEWLQDKPGIFVAFSEADLPAALSLAQDHLEMGTTLISRSAPAEFVNKVRQFLVE
ncbi:MAG: glycosyltransferase [Gallionellaceae bacterium]|nr:glycosyltransferase [Gallionellaceae bacterium]